MSVPPPVDRPTLPTMVSRLPTFGSQPRPQTAPAAASNSRSPAIAGSTRLTSGFYHHPGPVGVNGTTPFSSAKQNGLIRVPSSFSTKWKKENGAVNDGGVGGETEKRRGKGGNASQNRSSQYFSPVMSQQDAKRITTSSVGGGRGQSTTSSSSSSLSPSPQFSPRTLPVYKSRTLGSKPSQTTAGLANGTRQTLNSNSGSKLQSKANSSLRQHQSFARLAHPKPASGPGSRSGSPLQKKPVASRSHSSETLGWVPSIRLTENDRFRSRSLTQVRQQPSPTLTPSSTSSSSLPRSPNITRSYTGNKTVQRETSLSSPQASPRSCLLKSPVSRWTGRAGNVRGQSSASRRSEVSTPSQLPQSALKKTLLPSFGPTPRPSGISYKLSRPSLVKQSRPIRAAPANACGGDKETNQAPARRKHSVETLSSTENSPENTPDGPEGLSGDFVSQREASIIGETLEDMSLSSTSSFDRNDISQEYMDDFDNLGNGSAGILLFSSKNEEEDSGLDHSCTRLDDEEAVTSVTKATGLCFLDDGMDWIDRGEKEEHRLNQLSRRRKSSQPNYHEQGGSSLDLSPSDSCGSGGTYMWDEEGLEPLGGTATTASIHSNTTHHIGSFDSDINSVDILNNLDSCDLADDDLMLDSDLPDDSSLHSDGDGLPHMAQWRKRQLCWETQDNDNESDFQCYKLTPDPENTTEDKSVDFILHASLKSAAEADLPAACRSGCFPSGALGLGLDVEELAEDCSSVRSQLEFLQRLLLQEEDADEDTLTTDALSPETVSAHKADSQVQALLQEVEKLREELRSRDRTIAQLTMQLTVPTLTATCRCQETTEKANQHTQTSVIESKSFASQTLWKEHTSPILHSSDPEDQKPLTHQAPPPGNSTYAEMPAHRLLPFHKTEATDCSLQRGGSDGKCQLEEEEGNSRRETCRPRLPPQPSRLCHFLFRTSSSTLKSQKPRQPSGLCESDCVGPSGVKLKASPSSSSRLPKPKSH
ncbi:serine-rich coiled-coil domain-containing protein 2 isoform X3 [Nothobranchius furzeri]|uniref:serine-rich coiled-coil domain-containing protein 2 isoform X3 n=1 Tax=Nothobranchius furzeri TaxID=105023 RepID=UPI0039048F2A